MTERQARDEGAVSTALIMGAVKRHRLAKGWSAAQLADEMVKAGVPWNRSVVENLEYGRRKSLRVHEFLALAWLLDVPNPLDLLLPYEGTDFAFPVTPNTTVMLGAIRAWFKGETGPLRKWLDEPQPGEPTPEAMLKAFGDMPPVLRRQILWLMRSQHRTGWIDMVNEDGDGKD